MHMQSLYNTNKVVVDNYRPYRLLSVATCSTLMLLNQCYWTATVTLSGSTAEPHWIMFHLGLHARTSAYICSNQLTAHETYRTIAAASQQKKLRVFDQFMNQIIYGDGIKNVLFRTHHHKRFYSLSFPSEARNCVLMILSLLKACSQETCENDRVSKYW